MRPSHVSLLALVSSVFAQDDSNDNNSLNASLSGNDQLSNLTTLLSSAPGLLEQLQQANNITILAPNNDAFEQLANTSLGDAISNDPTLLLAVLQYHVLNGTYDASQITNTSTFVPTLLGVGESANVTGGQVVEAVTVDNQTVFYSGLLQNSTVVEADQNFTGGVLHVIDRILTVPTSVLDAANALNLTSLRGAINATDSIEAVNQPDITIFAPDNEAFSSIGSALANLTTDDLRGILGYHIVDEVLYSSDLENGTSYQTAGDGNLTITIDDDKVFVNAAQVVVPNILIANGVLHIIDNVLNPNNTEAPTESATAGAPGFTGSAVSEQPFTSGQPSPTTQINPTSNGPDAAATTSGGGDEGAAMPMMTGGVEYAAILGAGAAIFFGAA